MAEPRTRKHRGWQLKEGRVITTPESLRKAGHAAGTLTYQRGTGIFALTEEQHSEAGRMGGRIGGRIAADTGRVRLMGKIGGIRGGAVVGANHVKTGWLRHISLIRHHKSHNDCRFCNPANPEAF